MILLCKEGPLYLIIELHGLIGDNDEIDVKLYTVMFFLEMSDVYVHTRHIT